MNRSKYAIILTFLRSETNFFREFKKYRKYNFVKDLKETCDPSIYQAKNICLTKLLDWNLYIGFRGCFYAYSPRKLNCFQSSTDSDEISTDQIHLAPEKRNEIHFHQRANGSIFVIRESKF